MDTITIFEDTLKTVTVVQADKELIFKLFIFSWSIIRVIKSMFHEFDNNNFVLNNNIWIWPIRVINQEKPLLYNEKKGLNNTLQLFTLYLGIEKVLISIDVLKKKQKTKVRELYLYNKSGYKILF